MMRDDDKKDASTARRGFGDYDIGYRKPPLHSRFKPGVSGNPRGRPKATKNLKTDLAEELAERLLITENGRSRRISKQRLVLKASQREQSKVIPERRPP